MKKIVSFFMPVPKAHQSFIPEYRELWFLLCVYIISGLLAAIMARLGRAGKWVKNTFSSRTVLAVKKLNRQKTLTSTVTFKYGVKGKCSYVYTFFLGSSYNFYSPT